MREKKRNILNRGPNNHAIQTCRYLDKLYIFSLSLSLYRTQSDFVLCGTNATFSRSTSSAFYVDKCFLCLLHCYDRSSHKRTGAYGTVCNSWCYNWKVQFDTRDRSKMRYARIAQECLPHFISLETDLVYRNQISPSALIITFCNDEYETARGRLKYPSSVWRAHALLANIFPPFSTAVISFLEGLATNY